MVRTAHDERIEAALGAGSIALVSLFWFVHERPVVYSTLRMPRRQDLEALHPSPFLSPRTAIRVYRSRMRKVLVVTYGWGAPGEPDPSGELLAHLERFVSWLVRELALTPDELKEYGLFWDLCASSGVQRARFLIPRGWR